MVLLWRSISEILSYMLQIFRMTKAGLVSSGIKILTRRGYYVGEFALILPVRISTEKNIQKLLWTQSPRQCIMHINLKYFLVPFY